MFKYRIIKAIFRTEKNKFYDGESIIHFQNQKKI